VDQVVSPAQPLSLVLLPVHQAGNGESG
jgi:hypothetical protein